jgi:hydrogenase maturation protease
MIGLIVGIGNSYRGDDAVGELVVKALKHYLPSNYSTIFVSGDLSGLIEQWRGVDHLLIVDAVVSGAVTGEIVCLDLTNNPLPSQIGLCSTHAFGLREVVELARVLRMLPPKVEFIGVNGQEFGLGTVTTELVDKSIQQAVDLITNKFLLRNN